MMPQAVTRGSDGYLAGSAMSSSASKLLDLPRLARRWQLMSPAGSKVSRRAGIRVLLIASYRIRRIAAVASVALLSPRPSAAGLSKLQKKRPPHLWPR